MIWFPFRPENILNAILLLKSRVIFFSVNPIKTLEKTSVFSHTILQSIIKMWHIKALMSQLKDTHSTSFTRLSKPKWLQVRRVVSNRGIKTNDRPVLLGYIVSFLPRHLRLKAQRHLANRCCERGSIHLPSPPLLHSSSDRTSPWHLSSPSSSALKFTNDVLVTYPSLNSFAPSVLEQFVYFAGGENIEEESRRKARRAWRARRDTPRHRGHVQ